MNLGCGGNLGDCLWVTLLLAAISGPHTLAVKPEYHAAIEELMTGLHVTMAGVNPPPVDSLDMWIANGRHAAKDIHYSGQCDIMGFVRSYLNAQARDDGHAADPFASPESLLCRYPSLLRHCEAPAFEVLVVNCDPLSGQCPNYSRSELDGLLVQLRAKGHRVLCTNATAAAPWGNFTLAQIGNLSIRAKLIIAVASGPHWPTWNIWNAAVPRYIFLDPMRLDFGTTPTRHAACSEQMRGQLAEDGWL